MEKTETSIRFSGEGVSPETIGTLDLLACSKAFFECIQQESKIHLGQPVEIHGLSIRPGSAVACACVSASEESVISCIDSFSSDLEGANHGKKRHVSKLSSELKKTNAKGISCSADVGGKVIQLSVHRKEPVVKHMSMETFSAEVTGVWRTSSAWEVGLSDSVTDEKMTLSAKSDAIALEAGRLLSRRCVVDAFLEIDGEGNVSGGTIEGMSGCGAPLSPEEFSGMFSDALRNASVSSFLSEERGE